jgi:ATP-GRASP peptide maturase of grasp-with-spasm system
MILIISRYNDESTHEVINWLRYYHSEYLVLNENTPVTFRSLVLGEPGTDARLDPGFGEELMLSEISAYWYRRFELPLNIAVDEAVQSLTGDHLKQEKAALSYILHFLLEKVNRKIGSIFEKNINKLYCLYQAKAAGLAIPETHIITTKEDLNGLLPGQKAYVTKSVGDSTGFTYQGRHWFLYTEDITTGKSETPERFFPSLLQEKIDKKYELRIFYLKGKFYTMAIFSQSDKQTAVDFRKYNFGKPNRCVPYRLPETVSDKLKALMDNLGMDTGSVDMVVSKQGMYYFLEINPVGQFSFVSKLCNYQLERGIARELVGEWETGSRGEGDRGKRR